MGPWGFENIDESEEEGELAAGSGKKKKRVFNTGNPVVEVDADVGHEGGGSGNGEEVGAGEGGHKGGRALRHGMAGVRDGLGVFEVSMTDGDLYGLKSGGDIDGVDNSEVQLFQPLQHAAHEERWGDQGTVAEQAVLFHRVLPSVHGYGSMI